MKNSREHRVAVFLFHREVVAHGVLTLYSAAALDDACLVDHCFGKCSLAATRTAKQCNVFNLVSLINFHTIIVLGSLFTISDAKVRNFQAKNNQILSNIKFY